MWGPRAMKCPHTGLERLRTRVGWIRLKKVESRGLNLEQFWVGGGTNEKRWIGGRPGKVPAGNPSGHVENHARKSVFAVRKSECKLRDNRAPTPFEILEMPQKLA